MEPYHEFWRQAADIAAAAGKARGHERRRFRAAVGHALSFTTSWSLTHEQGLDDDEAIELMMRLVAPPGKPTGRG
jgi:hypothetical protein